LGLADDEEGETFKKAQQSTGSPSELNFVHGSLEPVLLYIDSRTKNLGQVKIVGH
jgi:hypothetical protein